jgi:glycerophosphoryl diester phosphodiesterase
VSDLRRPSIDALLGRHEPLLIAHAGGNCDAPQETLYAYRRAADVGSDVLELDVMLTADGVLVVHHDETVDRLTDGTGVVAEMTRAELQIFDAAYWFVPGCSRADNRPPDDYVLRGVRSGRVAPPAGFSSEDFCIPTFRDVAEAFPGLPLDVEIKVQSPAVTAATVAVLAGELEELDRVDSTVVVSFDSAVVDLMRARLPEVALSPGLDTLAAWAMSDDPLTGYRVVQIPPFHEGIELIPLMLDRAHAEGMAVWVWPNDPGTQENTGFYQELIDAGVDGVIAGSPRSWPAAMPSPGE